MCWFNARDYSDCFRLYLMSQLYLYQQHLAHCSLLADPHIIMAVCTLIYQRPPLLHCVLCRDRMERVGVRMQSENKRCILCCYQEGESLCKNCLIPWKPDWIKAVVWEELPEYLKRKIQGEGSQEEGHEVVCLQCISEEEYGLNVRNHLSNTQKIQLRTVERQFLEWGLPQIEIAEVHSVRLPVIASAANTPPMIANDPTATEQL